MVSNKLKFLQKNQTQAIDPETLIFTLVQLAEVLAYLMSNPNADVRKSVVFCLVEIHSAMKDDQVFNDQFMERLNQSQQKLVDIYIQRKLQMLESKK